MYRELPVKDSILRGEKLELPTPGQYESDPFWKFVKEIYEYEIPQGHNHVEVDINSAKLALKSSFKNQMTRVDVTSDAIFKVEGTLGIFSVKIRERQKKPLKEIEIYVKFSRENENRGQISTLKGYIDRCREGRIEKNDHEQLFAFVKKRLQPDSDISFITKGDFLVIYWYEYS